MSTPTNNQTSKNKVGRNYGQNYDFELTGYKALNIERNNAGFCNSVVSIVHRTVAKFHFWDVDIYSVMCLESTFHKRAVRLCLT